MSSGPSCIHSSKAHNKIAAHQNQNAHNIFPKPDVVPHHYRFDNVIQFCAGIYPNTIHCKNPCFPIINSFLPMSLHSNKYIKNKKIYKNNKKPIVNRSSGGNNQTKKSICQCPVQHVPMSSSSYHMGQTPYLSNDASYNSSPASNHCTRTSQRSRLTMEGTIVSQQQQQQQQPQQHQQRNNYTNNLMQYCGHDSKISTISNQVQAENNVQASTVSDVSNAYAHTHNAVSTTPVLPLIAHDDCAPVLLGRVRESRKPTCNNERLRSISSGSRHGYQAQNTDNDATTSTAFFLSGKVDAYLSFSHSQHFNRSNQQLQTNKIEEQLTTQVNNNPVLPPKLYKSLTNLKMNAATTTTTTITPTKTTLTVANKKTVPATSTSTLGRTIGTKQLQQQQQQPKMTLSISVMKNTSPSVVTMAPTTLSPFNTTKYSLEHKNNTIYNSPNRHNLTKGTTTTTSTTNSILAQTKPSHHCTINNVVSKVPSVINIPNMEQNHENVNTTTTNKPEAKINNNNKATITTTLPKKFISKNTKMLTTTTTTAVTTTTTATTNTDSKIIIKNKNVQSSNASTATGVSATTTTTTTINSNVTRTNNLLMAQTQSEDIASLNLLKVRPLKHLPVCTTTENCQNPREHYLPNDTSIDDDYLSECENCKIAQTAKYYLVDVKTRENNGSQRETMTLQRKSMDDAKEDQNLSGYYRVSHTLPSNSRKISPINNEPWYSTTSASSSSEDEGVD